MDDVLTTEIEVSVLQSINRTLDLLVTLHSKMKDMQSSLEFALNQIITPAERETISLQTTTEPSLNKWTF